MYCYLNSDISKKRVLIPGLGSAKIDLQNRPHALLAAAVCSPSQKVLSSCIQLNSLTIRSYTLTLQASDSRIENINLPMM